MSEEIKKREIRVFLSSTFRDMQFERDYLIHNIFPVIRQTCRERRVEFTEVDLRWGITEEEAMRGEVVRICLEEIDRCRPYFLGFMGERYGWAPADSDLHNKAELVELFPLVESSLEEKKSVTEMEILHGVLESPKMVEHAFFYIRNKSLTEQLAKESGTPNDYYDISDSAQAKLVDLKSRVKASGFPYYDNYSSLEALGEKIKADLLGVLDQRYPIDKVPTPIEAERMVHQVYADDRCQAYIPSVIDTQSLDSFLASRRNNTEILPLIIGGESGLGKSALLAYWLNTYQKNNPDGFIIQHFVGVSGDATPAAILRRIMLEIRARNQKQDETRNQEQDEVPSNQEKIVNDFPRWLAKVRVNDPLLLVIDAINQVEGDSLSWLPSYIPPNVTLIVSVLPGSHYDQLDQRHWQRHTVLPLDGERCQILIQSYLQTYRKKLSDKQIHTIANAPQCRNPLFLITLLEELRVFGVFEQIDARLADYLQAQDPAALFTKVLKRMEADYHDKNQVSTVPPILKVIWAARKGLTETELLGISGLNRQDLSIVLLALDYHLSNKNGLRNFFHDYLRQSVNQRYIFENEVIKAECLILANWFDKQNLNLRKAEELPWQWQRAGEMAKLKSCICDIGMFQFLYKINPLELVTYWRTLSDGAKKAGLAYWNSFVGQSATNADSAKIAIELGEFFLKYYVDPTASELFLRCAIDLNEKSTDKSAELNIISVLNLLARSLIDQGIPLGTEKICRRALKLCSDFQHSGEITAVHNLAEYLLNNGKEQEADEIYRAAVARRPITPLENESLEGAQLFYDYGEYLYKRRDDEQAYEVTRKALRIRFRILGKDDAETAKTYQNIAVLTKDVKNKEKYLRHALDILQKCFGDDHPETVIAKCNLAGMLSDVFDNPFCAESQSLLKSALYGWEKCRGGENHPDTPSILKRYQIDIDSCRDMYEECSEDESSLMEPPSDEEQEQMIEEHEKPENDARERVEYCEMEYGEHSAETANALEELIALTKDVNGKPELNENNWLNVLYAREKTSDPEGLYRALLALARVNKCTDNLNDSLSFYRRALAVDIPMPDKLGALNGCGNVLWDLKQYDEAKDMLLQEFSAKQYATADMWKLLLSGADLIKKLLEVGYFEDAEVVCRQILDLRSNDEKKFVKFAHSLGISLWGQGKTDEAEAVFRQEIFDLNKLNSADGDIRSALVDAQQYLARLLYEKGNYAAAEQFFLASLSEKQ